MSQYFRQPDINEALKDIRTRLKALSNTQATLVYTTATRPTGAGVSQGTIIFVSDAAAGSKFQGWDGASWVSLG